MTSPSAINKTITRIQVCLLGDEDEGNQEEGEPMDIETEAAGEPSSLRGRGKRGAEFHPYQLYFQMHSRSS